MTRPIPPDPMARQPKQEHQPEGLERDRWGRPMLLPAGATVRLPYTRASSLSDFITNQRGLVRWQERHMLRGLGMRPDLAQLAAAETYNTGFGMTDTKANQESGRRLDEIRERAMDASKASERADYGTTIHRHSEQGNAQIPIDPAAQADLNSLARAMRGFTVVAEELFVACDEVMAAGSFDKLVRIPGHDKAIVWDLKTGKPHFDGWQVQLAVYANGDMYEPDSDDRFTLESQFGPIETEWAIVAHVLAHSAKPVFYRVNLIDGMEAARHAAWVRDYQARTHSADPLPLDMIARARACELIDEAPADPVSVNSIYDVFADVWSEGLTVRASHKLSQATPTI